MRRRLTWATVATAAAAALALLPSTTALADSPGNFSVTAISLPSRVVSIAVDSATGLAYVAGYELEPGQGTVTVIDTGTPSRRPVFRHRGSASTSGCRAACASGIWVAGSP